jgi:MFS transporter, UMF1 family
VLYQSGMQAVIALAAIYAQQAMRFTMRDTLLLVLVVNVTASLGALGSRSVGVTTARL